MCVTWLIHMRDMTHSYVWRDSFICVPWLIHTCDMSYSHMWHDSFICVPWLLIHMCDMTHSHAWHVSFTCVTWLVHMCAMMTHSYLCPVSGRTLERALSKHTATHCNTLQHTATHCNTLQHTATAEGHWRGRYLKFFCFSCISFLFLFFQRKDTGEGDIWISWHKQGNFSPPKLLLQYVALQKFWKWACRSIYHIE